MIEGRKERKRRRGVLGRGVLRRKGRRGRWERRRRRIGREERNRRRGEYSIR